MSVASAFLHDSDARRPVLAIAAALQQIASAAHLRGVEITRSNGAVLDRPPARDLMRYLRGAWNYTRTQRPDRQDQVEGIIRGTCSRLHTGGAVQLSAQLFGVVRAYAGKL